jgi:hypothetical protein
MAMNMDALLRIKADVQGENNIRRLGNSMQGLQGQVKNAQLSFNNLKGAIAGFGAAIAGSAIVGGLTAIVKQSIDAGDSLNRLQMITGISAKSLTGIANEAKLADVDMEALGKGLTKLNVSIAKAANGNADLAQKFKDLGINVRDTKGNVKPTDEVLKQLADRFADMPDGAQKAAAAVGLFGKSGAQLIPLLNDGAAAMEKFTYKVSDDFAARSDLFNDSVTTLGIKTKGFGLELTDALLPALQSVLNEFSNLFDTKNDWSALFTVITVGFRGVATFLFATIKLMDQWIKTIVNSFDAINKALHGDFAGAGQAISKGFGASIEQAKQDFAAIQRMWSDAPSPGTGRRTSGTELNPTDLNAQRENKRAANEHARALEREQRILEKRNELQDRGRQLLEDLKRSQEDVNGEIKKLGASDVQQIYLDWDDAIKKAKRGQEDMTQKLADFIKDAKKAGGTVDLGWLKNATDAIDAITSGRMTAANQARDKRLADKAANENTFMDQLRISSGTLGSDEERRLRINERLAQIQKDMPELYAKQGKEIRDLVTASEGLTEVQQRNKDLVQGIADSIGGALKSGFDALINGTKDWAGSLREIAGNLLKSIIDQLLQIMVIKPIVSGITKAFGFANGGIMTAQGEMPLRKYAAGGIANSPQLAMFGEGSMNEAYVPLPDGRRIPVAMKGGGGGNNITVNVDAKGSSVQGDSGKGNQLARVIAAAVQDEMIKQKRPGGLLAA